MPTPASFLGRSFAKESIDTTRSAALLVAVLSSAPLTGTAQSAAGITISDVVRLVSAGVSADTTVAAIEQARQRQFDVTTAGLAALKQAGVPESVIAAMLWASPPAPVTTPAPALGRASSLVGLTTDQARRCRSDPHSVCQRSARQVEGHGGTWLFCSCCPKIRRETDHRKGASSALAEASRCSATNPTTLLLDRAVGGLFGVTWIRIPPVAAPRTETSSATDSF